MKFLYTGILGAIAVAMLIISPRFFMFSIVALAPAFVARTLDRLPGRNTSTTVLLLNISGLVLFAEQLMKGSASFGNLASIFDTKMLLVVYMFAGLGWFIVWLVPRLTVIFVDYKNENRARRIQKKIDELVEEWGDELKN